MTRVVVRVAASPKADQTDEEIYFSLDDPPYEIRDSESLQPFLCERSSILDRFYEDPPSGDNMREVGETLLDRLGRHPAVAEAVSYALKQTPPDGSCPLYLRLIGSETAAEYPWETLFDPEKGFLALQDRWPIARIAAQVPREKNLRTFTPPLKVMAVMSAIGVPAAAEWDALREAVVDSGIDLPVELNVWVGERDLQTKIANDLKANSLSGTVTMLSDGPKLLREVKKFDPHILHLFCHGTGGPQPLLQMATRRDHVLGRGSSVLLEPLQLRGIARSSWLVTLNCCEGGSDSDGARSIAYLLISAGYPAIVGMREPVSSANAARFARSFYTSLLGHLDSHLVVGEEVEIEVAASLVTPRRELRDQYTDLTPTEAAARHRDWTMPVLYVRPDPLTIKRVAAHPKHDEPTRHGTTQYLDTLMKFRLEAAADTPADVLTRIDAEIDRALKELAGVGE